MRIAHVVTLISPDGAYGGPVRVAINQAKALVDRGHTVTIFAGTRGFEVPPTSMDGIELALFPVRQIVPGTGFAGLWSPSMHRAFRKRLTDFDVVHIHLARDLIVMPIASLLQRRRKTYVVQTHGMIDPSSHPLAAPFDLWATRRVLRSAARRLYLTDREYNDLRSVLGSDSHELSLLPNGVPLQASAVSGGGSEVLFLARLQTRKQPALFVEAAATLHHEFPNSTFALVGPDEGEAHRVDEMIKRNRLESTVRWEGALDASSTIARMKEASIYVLPSVDEPFPMSVLEAMSVGLPVIVSDSCGLAQAIHRSSAGVVFDGSGPSLTSALRRLLADPYSATQMGRAGRDLVTAEYSIESTAVRLELIYEQSTINAR